MESYEGNPITAMISPEALDFEANWDAVLFLRSKIQLISVSRHLRALSETAVIFEGDREMGVSIGVGPEASFRAGSISAFEITPTHGQWLTIPKVSRSSLEVGDVVLKRLTPVTVAVVPAGLPLLPVDGSFFVVRGLPEEEAWWITICLNNPAFADYLVSKSGRGILGRVSLSVLRAWSAPVPPHGFHHQARRLRELLQKRTFLAGQIAALQAEVETAVSGQMESTSYEEEERRFSQPSWAFFVPSTFTNDSLLPIHAAASYRGEVLRRDRGWQPLSTCLAAHTSSRIRFSSVEEPISVLRLSDVAAIPLVPTTLKPTIPIQPTRVFREPVQADEVLLSTLGSSPSVAFVPFSPIPPVYPVDLWERLEFRYFAAAYALVLKTGAISRQLRALASGSVQQFVRSEDIQRVFLPVFPEHTLAQWDRSFRSLAKAWLQTDSEWQAALRDGWLAFNRAFKLSTREDSVSNL